MAINPKFVYTALLGTNYLPNQKPDPSELPSSLSSTSLAPRIADRIAALNYRKASGFVGYDSVTHHTTRFDGRRRHISIPHPLPYARLCSEIQANWGRFDHIAANTNSKTRPMQHSDGRLFKMSYADWKTRTRGELLRTQGKELVVSADVAQCFPSIYSHSIAWALVGVDHAKRHKQRHHWFNKLDNYSTMLKRAETNGLLIGPGTSNIMLEIIFSNIDNVLSSNGFDFHRYVDDYTAYVENHNEADRFRNLLSDQLSKYNLFLNRAKYREQSLPGARVSWAITALRRSLPSSNTISRYQAISYLDFAVGLSNEHPDVSTIKFGLKSLLRKDLGKSAYSDLFLYTLTLAERQPDLMPLLELFPAIAFQRGMDSHKADLSRIVTSYCDANQSDGILWACHHIKRAGSTLDDSAAAAVLNLEDPLGLCMLISNGTAGQKDAVVELHNSKNHSDLYELDRRWLVAYELYRRNLISNPYTGNDGRAFDIMKEEAVEFFV